MRFQSCLLPQLLSTSLKRPSKIPNPSSMEEEEEQFNVEDDHIKRVSSVNLDSSQAYDEYFDDGEDMLVVSCVIK